MTRRACGSGIVGESKHLEDWRQARLGATEEESDPWDADDRGVAPQESELLLTCMQFHRWKPNADPDAGSLVAERRLQLRQRFSSVDHTRNGSVDVGFKADRHS